MIFPKTRFVGTIKKPIWELEEEFFINPFKVPKGFRYDKTTTPRFLWSLIPPFGIYEAAALIHDWMYYNKGSVNFTEFSRKECDLIFYQDLLHYNVPKKIAKSFYIAVRLFGKRRWNRTDEIEQIWENQ